MAYLSWTLVIPLLTLIGLISPSLASHSRAVFSPHQYAILDSNITFFAHINAPNHDKYQIFWSETYWATSPRKKDEEMSAANNFTSNWTLPFTSDEFHPGNYSVTCTIYYYYLPYLPIDYVTQLLSFTLSDHFTGKFIVNNVTRHRRPHSPFLISTLNTTDIQIHVDSPGLLDLATNLTWTWYNNQTIIANTTTPHLSYNFSSATIYPLTASLTATFNNTIKSNVTLIKTGNFSANFSAKVPIVSVNVSGDTWYRNDGRLLRVKITCQGTGPYQYCLNVEEGAHNVTGNETCKTPEVTNDCEIPFAWYLGEGIHTLLVIIGNDLGRYVNQTPIHVYKVARVQPLSLILVPITCSIIALVLIIFGIGYFWENRKRYNVEVADFDFGQHDELPYMTFMERLKDAMSSSALNRQRHIPPPEDYEPILSSRVSS